MTALITILSIILLFVVILQIAKINEITADMKGEDEFLTKSAELNGKWLIIFCVVFLVGGGPGLGSIMQTECWVMDL